MVCFYFCGLNIKEVDNQLSQVSSDEHLVCPEKMHVGHERISIRIG